MSSSSNKPPAHPTIRVEKAIYEEARITPMVYKMVSHEPDAETPFAIVAASSMYDHIDYISTMIDIFPTILIVTATPIETAWIALLLQENYQVVDSSDDSDIREDIPVTIVSQADLESAKYYQPDVVVFWNAAANKMYTEYKRDIKVQWVAFCGEIELDRLASDYPGTRRKIYQKASRPISCMRVFPDLNMSYSALLAPEAASNYIQSKNHMTLIGPDPVDFYDTRYGMDSPIANYSKYYTTMLLLRHLAGPILSIQEDPSPEPGERIFMTSHEAIYAREIHGGSLDVPGHNFKSTSPGMSRIMLPGDLCVECPTFRVRAGKAQYDIEECLDIPDGTVVYFNDRVSALTFMRVHSQALYLDIAMPATYLAAAMHVHQQSPFPMIVSYRVAIRTETVRFPGREIWDDAARLARKVLIARSTTVRSNVPLIDDDRSMSSSELTTREVLLLSTVPYQRVEIDGYVPKTAFNSLVEVCEEMSRQEYVAIATRVIGGLESRPRRDLVGTLRMLMRLHQGMPIV